MTTTVPDWAKKASDQPWLQVSIAPALYAGPTQDTERAIRPLVDAGAVRLDDGHGNQLIISPDSRVRLGVEPETDNTMWKVAVHESPNLPALWTVTLTESTPVEVVEAITTDLANRLRTGARLSGGADDDEWPTPLHAHGWTLAWDAATQTKTARSERHPQSTIVLNARDHLGPDEWEEAEDAFWSINVAGDHDGWAAAASISTPDQILYAMVSAMLAPAIRDIGDLNELAVSASLAGSAELTELSSSPTPQGARRAQAASARSRLHSPVGEPFAQPAPAPPAARPATPGPSR
ncbi:DUF317 domain-containing protein [Kitasatospora sp. NPDC047058]|uniref:DUF317 domain-containing protein n=1 Tax=Kitasatospora sp. NPDC047058 TaxID=3155620 RepID=UPI00340F515E